MNSNVISNLGNPTAATDATNRQWVEQRIELPIGTILTYFGNSTPSGFLYCNGSTFVASDYPELFALLGSNTLPDLRGQFLRGTSDSNTVDPDGPRTAGSVQLDEFKSHAHTGTVTYVDTYATENLGTNLGYLGHSDPDYDN
jgi:microcystin-dependent protein